MKRTTTILTLGGATLGLASLGLAIIAGPKLLADSAPHEGSTAAVTASAAAPPAPSPSPVGAHGLPVRRFLPGATYVYAIESGRTVAIEGSRGGGASTLTAEMSISVVERLDDGVRLRCALGSVRQGANDSPELRLDPLRLTQAFYVTVTPTGAMKSFAFAAGQSAQERAAMKGLAASLQLVVPSAGATLWEATELDASGEYQARYQVQGDHVHKSKDHYLRTRGARGLVPVHDPSKFTVASSIDIALDASGWPRTVNEDETLTVNAGAAKFVSRATTRATLARAERTPDLAALVAAEARSLEAEPDADSEAFASARRHADEGLVGGASHATLLQGFGADNSTSERNKAMGRMAALLRTRPEETRKTLDAVLHGDLDTEGKQRLVGSLGSAGTKEAREALASVLDSKDTSVEVRANAAASLGLSADPTEEDVDALRNGASSSDEEVKSASTLGLGNLAKRMNESGSSDPTDVIGTLIAALSSATTDAQRVLCLNALGNSGDPAALPAISAYLSNPSTTLRATAVKALRFIGGDEADAALGAALQDFVPEVRLAAANALAFRAITPLLPTVEGIMKTGSDVSLRLALVQSMWARRKLETQVKPVLSWSAENDPSEQVRVAASKALGA